MLAAALLISSAAQAQFSASSLTEYQLGNLPDDEPSDLSNFYGHLDLTWRQNTSSIGLRLESFQSSIDERSYDHLTQRYFEWNDGPFKVRLGNFYTTLGRGLVLRAFELPNVIFEQRSFRRRYSYFRDIDGILVSGVWKHLEFTLLHGKPLNNNYPPQIEGIDRREGVVDGAELKLRPAHWLMAGSAYAKTHFRQFRNYEINSLFGEITLNRLLRQAGLQRASLSLYAEHARSFAKTDNFFSTKKSDPHATYLSLNFGYNKIGLTAEYKDYRQFETSMNLPPILYKEHSYYLLNRTTHELLSDFENGYQLELSYRPITSILLVGNWSVAKNDAGFSTFDFADRFLEATVYATPDISTKVFYDWSKDEVKGEDDRRTSGIDLEWSFYRNYAITIEQQYQGVDKNLGPELREFYVNSYSSITLSKAPSLSLSAVVNRSTDSSETDDATTQFKIERNPRYWLSFVGSYQVNMSNELTVFVGARRGGLVCLSGTCYEVLPFKGLELRWITTF